jgi:hypothetical protein
MSTMQNYNYTEEHYAEMYNNLPEGLKDLVLSGRLAIQVSAIGSRHGLNADQVANLEPAIEDVCLGLITKAELAENIKAQVGLDERVSNRVAAEAEIEIFRPFEPELVIARQQKEEIDARIGGQNKKPTPKTAAPSNGNTQLVQANQVVDEPEDISDHSNVSNIKNWYSKEEKDEEPKPPSQMPKSFDWDKDFGKKEEPKKEAPKNISSEKKSIIPDEANQTRSGVEEKIDKLTESINQLVNARFGGDDKKDSGLSEQMKELMKRLEKAEAENEENKKLIQKLQGGTPVGNAAASIFGESVIMPGQGTSQPSSPKTDSAGNKIQIDKERKVEIEKQFTPIQTQSSGNIQITSVSKQIPIQKETDIKSLTSEKNNSVLEMLDTGKKSESKKEEVKIQSSAVSLDTVNAIVETRSKEESPTTITSAKKALSIEELVQKGDQAVKDAAEAKTVTLVFPGINDEKRVDITSQTQASSLRQTLLDDLEFLKKKDEESVKTKEEILSPKKEEPKDESAQTPMSSTSVTADLPTSSQTAGGDNPFKDELLPKTKEDRMKSLQDKIKAMNKGVTTGGKTNITASGLDPYKI